VSENVYSKVLSQLVAGEGSSTQAVASLLKVPEKTLERWMLGHSQMPLRAFLRALELVVQHEQRDGTLVPAQPAPEPLRFHAGPVAATCAKCGHERFRRVDPAARPTYSSMLACLGCGSEVAHGDLIAALAKEVSRRAGTYVARARARRQSAKARTQ
jgi:hypothetical protein